MAACPGPSLAPGDRPGAEQVPEQPLVGNDEIHEPGDRDLRLGRRGGEQGRRERPDRARHRLPGRGVAAVAPGAPQQEGEDEYRLAMITRGEQDNSVTLEKQLGPVLVVGRNHEGVARRVEQPAHEELEAREQELQDCRLGRQAASCHPSIARSAHRLGSSADRGRRSTKRPISSGEDACRSRRRSLASRSRGHQGRDQGRVEDDAFVGCARTISRRPWHRLVDGCPTGPPGGESSLQETPSPSAASSTPRG